ncbi:MAG: DEAD/DEAH box helicase, partial [Phaeodactylibacter sp.]|nr:DEAD/DEAH box helicase [Phaeodactylibacter sp.]
MNMEKAKAALKEIFGFPAFRPMQSDIIEAVISSKDVFVLMPTGGGKSLCYQIPALVLPGCAVVVSPLISLMKDQVEALRANGVRAAFLNSSLVAGEQRQVEDDFFNGQLDLLYVSPEKLVSQEFQPLLKQAKINLFAIDEAHCISSWGHDFRPEYTQLKYLRA